MSENSKFKYSAQLKATQVKGKDPKAVGNMLSQEFANATIEAKKSGKLEEYLRLRSDLFTFESEIDVSDLSPENIRDISDGFTQILVNEAAHILTNEPNSLHIRFGGGHSRQFSKSSGHRNVIHSKWGGGGSAGKIQM